MTRQTRYMPPIRFEAQDGRVYYLEAIRKAGSHRARLRRDLGDGWTVSYELLPGDPIPVVESVDVSPTEALPAGGLTARVLRRVRLELDVRTSTELMQHLRDVWGEAAFADGRPLSGFEAALEVEPVRPGRKGHPDVEYAKVAAKYVARLRQGSRRPIADIADEGNHAPTWIRELVHRARKKGMLTAAPPGRAGGELTDKARELLQRQEGDD